MDAAAAEHLLAGTSLRTTDEMDTEMPAPTNYPIPDDEPTRIETLNSYGLLDTPPEQPYERLVQVAQRVLDVPIAGFCLLDSERQWFKAVRGTDLRETAREVAFCTHVVADGEALLVPDATVDPRFRTNPLVTSDPGVRAYAGMPVHAHDGSTIGTLLALDTVRRRFTDQEVSCMRVLAERLEEHIELRRLALRLESHRAAGTIEDARADELDQLWSASGDMLMEELAELERQSPSAQWRIDPDQTMSFSDAVDRLTGTFDMAKQMAINFRHLGQTRDGGFELMRETFAPTALSGVLQQRFERRFEAQNRALVVQDFTDDFELRADLGVLRRALEHLIDNAISYSPVGTDVRIELQSDAEWLTVRVSDRGPGPNKRLGDDVFEEGVSRQTLIDSGSPGPRRGDGLAYVQGAIDAHGGIVGYDHDDPTGCVFWFCIPSNPHGLPVEH